MLLSKTNTRTEYLIQNAGQERDQTESHLVYEASRQTGEDWRFLEGPCAIGGQVRCLTPRVRYWVAVLQYGAKMSNALSFVHGMSVFCRGGYLHRRLAVILPDRELE